ncbi:MAG: HAMP domain-containing sensor histidine kinase [Hyphomicrobiales bacterium]
MTDFATETQTKNERQHPNRERADRRHAVNNAVRNARENLTSETGYSIDFDRDVLLAHARNFNTAGLIVPWFIIFTGMLSLTWYNYFHILAWIFVSLTAQMLIVHQNMKFLKKMPDDPKDLEGWRRIFVCGDLLSGIVWSTFLLIPVSTSSLSQPVFLFATLLVVVALYSFIAAPLFIGMLAATSPITMVLVVVFFQTGYSSLTMMAGLFVAAQLLFIMLGKQVRSTLLQLFKIKVEKDGLIVELEEATAISNDSRRRAEEANLAKSRFLATMSHELRTPLNAIIGFSEIMKEELLGPLENASYKEYVTDIHSSGDHLLNLINEILDLSRVEAGRYELNEEAISIVEVLNDCNTLMMLRAKNKDIKIKITTEPGMNRIWADERAIRQIILNLMANAVKFTPQGGEINVLVGWTKGGGQYIAVRDNGPGIPEEEIPIVLSQFGQGSLAIKSAEQGTGLGLPICQALINMHSGTLDLKSKLRVGTSVTVSLPKGRVIEALAPKETNSRNVVQQTPQRVMHRRSA